MIEEIIWAIALGSSHSRFLLLGLRRGDQSVALAIATA